MTSRRKLAAALLAAGLPAIAGCVFDRKEGATYRLEMAPGGDSSGDVLDFDALELDEGEREILLAAIEDGEYEERWVNWDDVPNRDVISEPFKSLLRRITEHEYGEKRAPPTAGALETPSRFDGDQYETTVVGNSAE